jgi:peroxiredoxin
MSQKVLEKVDPSIERGVLITESFQINKIIFLIAIALVLKAILNYTPPLIPLKVGDKAPAFSLKLREGTIFDFSPSHASHSITGGGKPMVIFFYANWCPCSNHSAPLLKQAFEEFSSSGVSFIGIGIQDKEEELNGFIERHKLHFNTGFDIKQEIARSFGVATTPTTIFVNKEGKIDSIFVGKIKKYDDISERVRKTL